jgi:2-polyprenyl-6-methoxyphenol hydroxylase-like FAD-dependent oxidoreductase
MNADVIDLMRNGERVTGVRASTPEGAIQVRSPLTVACDGRWSVVRECAGLPVRNFAMPIDVLWFRLPRRQGAEATLGLVGGGQLVLTIDRGDYWQCGTVIPKGTFEQLRADGLDTFRAIYITDIPRPAGFLGENLAVDKLLSAGDGAVQERAFARAQ